MENLPVEIFYQIFDYLQIETIFFTIRPVSRSFQSIVLNYDRWNFHLKIASKAQFDVLCRFIPPQNIRSLTLYNNEQTPDQISTFLQQVRLRQLTQLHSIDLDGIDEFQLNYLCKRINLNLLRSFSIRISEYDDRRRKTTVNYLSTIVKQINLRRLYLDVENSRISDLSWPINCSIECLTINGNVKFDDLVKIFSCSPQLHRLIIKRTSLRIRTNHGKEYSFVQLKSLIIEVRDLEMNELNSFLLLTPSLSYLKLLGHYWRFDGKRWEDFVQVNLPHLEQFQFNIQCWQFGMIERTRGDFERIMKSFRSPFWVEDKKWFVQCQWDPENSSDYELYSIPLCKSPFQINFSCNREMISTGDQTFQTTNIDQITLRLGNYFTESMKIPSFPNVTKLHLYFDGQIASNSTNLLSKIINLSQLTEIQLECFYLDRNNEDFFYDILTQLAQSSQLSMLVIRSGFCQEYIYSCFERIVQRIPSQIKYFQIPINDVEHIGMIIEHCHQLRILQIPEKSLSISEQIQEWFDVNTIGSIFSQSDDYDTIWIGKIPQAIQSNVKRIKLI